MKMIKNQKCLSRNQLISERRCLKNPIDWYLDRHSIYIYNIFVRITRPSICYDIDAF